MPSGLRDLKLPRKIVSSEPQAGDNCVWVSLVGAKWHDSDGVLR